MKYDNIPWLNKLPRFWYYLIFRLAFISAIIVGIITAVFSLIVFVELCKYYPGLFICTILMLIIGLFTFLAVIFAKEDVRREEWDRKDREREEKFNQTFNNFTEESDWRTTDWH
jgi:hypothetical protein